MQKGEILQAPLVTANAVQTGEAAPEEILTSVLVRKAQKSDLSIWLINTESQHPDFWEWRGREGLAC